MLFNFYIKIKSTYSYSNIGNVRMVTIFIRQQLDIIPSDSNSFVLSVSGAVTPSSAACSFAAFSCSAASCVNSGAMSPIGVPHV